MVIANFVDDILLLVFGKDESNVVSEDVKVLFIILKIIGVE
jgi:hypothetical protein